MKMSNGNRLTVGDLKRQLEVFDNDEEVFFGNDENALTFYRTKSRGPKLVQIEFNQQIYRDSDGRLVVEE